MGIWSCQVAREAWNEGGWWCTDYTVYAIYAVSQAGESGRQRGGYGEGGGDEGE